MKFSIKKMIRVFISLPKTLYFNIRIFDLKTALKMPTFIAYDVTLSSLKGKVILPKDVSTFMVKIGLGGSEGVTCGKGYFKNNGIIQFKGKASFGKGVSIRVDQGMVCFGNNFSCNRNCFISVSNQMSFGNNTLLGFNISIRDSDGHKVYYNGNMSDEKGVVDIGNHVWIASDVKILKNTIIADDSVICGGSCLWGDFSSNPCSLIGGYPSKVIRENIKWEE